MPSSTFFSLSKTFRMLARRYAFSILRSSALRPLIPCEVTQIRSPSLLLTLSYPKPSWHLRSFSACRSLRNQQDFRPPQEEEKTKKKLAIRENIYTIPNVLTVSRILACPVLGWAILNDNFYLASGLLLYAGASDFVSMFGLQCCICTKDRSG